MLEVTLAVCAPGRAFSIAECFKRVRTGEERAVEIGSDNNPMATEG